MEKNGKRASFYLSCKVVKAFPKKNQYGEDGYGVCFPGGYYDWRPKRAFESMYRDISEFAHEMEKKGATDVVAMCYLSAYDQNAVEKQKKQEGVGTYRLDLTLDF